MTVRRVVRRGRPPVATAGTVSKDEPPSDGDLASLLNKSWELPNQTEPVQELKKSFAQTLQRLTKYRRLLVPYRRGSDVVLLLLDDWNRIVEQHHALEARLERLEDLLEEVELAPTILERAEANKKDPKRLMGLAEFMAGVRAERP
jgi:uncharacterized membrane protein YccC